jgi:hypothetical protein
MRFLNKNAYIQTAIFGSSFCTSAKEAFFLILRCVHMNCVSNEYWFHLLRCCVIASVSAHKVGSLLGCRVLEMPLELQQSLTCLGGSSLSGKFSSHPSPLGPHT